MSRLFPPENECIGKIHDQLAYLAKIQPLRPPILPTHEQISQLIETAFWTGIQFSEGRSLRFCLALVPPGDLPGATRLADIIPCRERDLVKISSAVPPGGCLGVSWSSDGPEIWGIAPTRLGLVGLHAFTVEVLEPGTLRVGVGPYPIFAVLNGRSDHVLVGTQFDLPHHLGSALRKKPPEGDILETNAVWRECLALTALVRLILADGHGGLLLVVPAEDGDWENSIYPFTYRFASPDRSIPDGIRQEFQETSDYGEALTELYATSLPDDVKTRLAGEPSSRQSWDIGKFVRPFAPLARVDGAVVLTRDLKVLGFGATISVKSDVDPQWCDLGARGGGQQVHIKPLQALPKGTRHQNALRFAGANKDSVAIVISQDRYVSIMYWYPDANSVAFISDVEWWV